MTVTDGGYAKRTGVDDWTAKGRGTLGVTAMKLVEERGSLVGAMICDDDDEVYAIASNGIVIRTWANQVRARRGGRRWVWRSWTWRQGIPSSLSRGRSSTPTRTATIQRTMLLNPGRRATRRTPMPTPATRWGQ